MRPLLTMFATAQEEFIASTEEFIADNELWLQSTISLIGWKIGNNAVEIDRPDLVVCPINSEHRMPAESIDRHVVKCEKKHGSYPDISDVDLTIDPCLSSVLQRERDHIANQSNRLEASKEQTSSSLTLAELLQAERDAKRRRAAHRGKRVHSNKKSYNEVMREVIANQMSTLSDSVESDRNIEENCKPIVQESNVQNSTYLGLGDPFFRGNPYKRWLTIEQEEKVQIEKMKKQSTKCSHDKRRDERSPRHSRIDRDHQSSHREDPRRHYTLDRDYKKDEPTRQRNRSVNRTKPQSYHRSYDRDFNRERSRGKDRDMIRKKYVHSLEIADTERNKPQKSCENDYQNAVQIIKSEKSEDCDKSSTLERKRKYEESVESSDEYEKRHKKKKKKKKKKHKHKKSSRRSSSSD